MKKITCCYKCEERYPACWGECERYKKEKAEIITESRRSTQDHIMERMICDIQYTGLRKARKGKK